MKKTFVFALALILLVTVFPAEAFATGGKVTINVYNWGQYISDGTDGYIDVNKAFTEETGIEVNYMTYDSNETLYTKLKTGGSSYDIIIPSDYMISRLIEEDMLEEINFDNIPNYKNIDEAYKNTEYDPDNKYSVPYTWGTVGVIYNTKYVDQADIGSWDLLWNDKYSGKILMFNNPRDSFAIAEYLLGYSVNTVDEAELRATAEKLKEQKPLVQTYVMDQIFNLMEHEEAWIGTYYAGDYLLMAEENDNLAFYYPEEGFNLFIDAICIPKGCKNKEAAEKYIDFLCRPEISGENLSYLGYSTPISAAKEYMDEEVAESPIAYPDENVLAKGTSFNNLPANINQLMDDLWLDVKTQTDKEGIDTYLIVFIVIAVLVAAAIVGVTVSRKSKRQNRGR